LIRVAVGILSAVVALVGLVACQKAVNIGVVNTCGSSVEVMASSVPELGDWEWHSVDSDGRSYVLSAATTTEKLFFWVRNPGEEEPSNQFEAMITDLANSVDQTGYDTRIDRELVLEGDRCPS
jgi:hypothetical protein